ncbi:MAG: DUF4433 domain-containing protein [Clostridia bacterium]|nr:DUF4433 domain-containing protein [Clostridia bacterium]
MNHIDLDRIKLYHIIHIDKLPHILNLGKAGRLLCDSDVQKQHLLGTTIGMSKIKERRMNELTLNSHPDLYVGDCVPFYFCPRSIMLYMFHQNNHPDIAYRGGQKPIVHLVFKMMDVIDWANQKGRRWAFTDSNAGSRYFNDYCNLSEIDTLNWDAINTDSWSNCKEEKQAEFLVERSLPWHLVKEIGVYSLEYCDEVGDDIEPAIHKPPIRIKREWYY